MTTSTLRSTTVAGYIARTTSSSGFSMILAEDGEFYHESFLGPGQRSAKVYKTARGASATRGQRTCTAHAVNACGIEIA